MTVATWVSTIRGTDGVAVNTWTLPYSIPCPEAGGVLLHTRGGCQSHGSNAAQDYSLGDDSPGIAPARRRAPWHCRLMRGGCWMSWADSSTPRICSARSRWVLSRSMHGPRVGGSRECWWRWRAQFYFSSMCAKDTWPRIGKTTNLHPLVWFSPCCGATQTRRRH